VSVVQHHAMNPLAQFTAAIVMIDKLHHRSFTLELTFLPYHSFFGAVRSAAIFV
jgi:hypothetical protein